ncbi:hypothetical protein CSOJ01_10149 [Colletotrichum sojae]|uniref:Uncharacterized protein n=1 Tax=Colletotrichum sojae TaxID=2175907 RepID=A0A8H6J110_9PEZI|nr:hypothetical protein CSOJ01_10149 [Colletotrichum sojae]
MEQPRHFQAKQASTRSNHEATPGLAISPVVAIFNVISFFLRQIMSLFYAGTAMSAVFSVFFLGLPFGRQFEGMLRLAYHIIRIELGRPYASFPTGGGTVRRWS